MNNAMGVLSRDSISLGQILADVKNTLKENGFNSHDVEARKLVCHAFDIDSVSLISNSREAVDTARLKKLGVYLSRRLAGEPIARIIGKTEFFGNVFYLNKNTLEPRSDTETIVEAILADFVGRQDAPIDILDIGTGSGAIAISLAGVFGNSDIVATDINVKALEMAKSNALENGVCDKIEFVKSNWFEDVGGKFDLIVSNPPYICTDVIPTLAIEVRDHDPLMALDGGQDGLAAYRDILLGAGSKFKNQGRLYLEIGFDQAQSVILLATELNWKLVRLEQDLCGEDRVLIFEK